MQAIKRLYPCLRKFSGLTILISVNAVIFIVLRLIAVIFNITGAPDFEQSVLHNIELPADCRLLLYRPWTPITYMFCQFDAWHIVLNMLIFFWIGQLFMYSSGSKRLIALYLCGGFVGAAVFIGVSVLAPGLSTGEYLTGSSASVFAIMTATAFIMPKSPVFIPLIGEIQLRWIVIGLIVLDLCLGANGENAGGHIAHIGGVAAGAIYPLAVKLLNGKHHNDSKVRGCADTSDAQNLDIILDKIKRSGYASLTSGERKQLFDISNRIK